MRLEEKLFWKLLCQEEWENDFGRVCLRGTGGEGWKETMVFCSCISFFYSWLGKDSNSFHWFKYSSKNENDSLTSSKGFRKIVKVKFLAKLRKKCLVFPSLGLHAEIYRVNLAFSPNAGKSGPETLRIRKFFMQCKAWCSSAKCKINILP